MYAYTKDVVRLWAPSFDRWRGSNNQNAPQRTSWGWGGEYNTWAASLVQVKVRAWLAYPGVQDTGTVRVTVRDVQEPPMLNDMTVVIPEIVDGVKPLVRLLRCLHGLSFSVCVFHGGVP